MYKLLLLLVCLACIGDGRRVKATLDQHLSSQGVKGQKLMKQLNSRAGSRSHGQAKTIVNPRSIVPILLTFLSPGAVFAPSSNGSAFNSSIYNNTSSNPIGANVEEALQDVSEPTVRVVVTVDWEGMHLVEENLAFFHHFREAHPLVPLTHFLSAAYFTKAADQSIREWSPYQASGPIDEHALQIHGWKSLIESSGVKFRSESNVWQTPKQLESSLESEKLMRELIRQHQNSSESKWGNSPERIQLQDHLSQDVKYDGVDIRHLLRELMDTDSSEYSSPWQNSHESTWGDSSEWTKLQNYLSRDVGYDTDIRAYSVEELQMIIQNSKKILEKQGLKVGKSFRVGQRLIGPNVLEAFQREGFRINSSAVNLDEKLAWLSSEEQAFFKDAPVTAMVRELWPDITKDSQPFLKETPVGWVLEMPDTGVPADHSTAKDMVDQIDSAVQQLGSEDRFVNIGLTQESASIYGPRVIEAITEIKRKHGHRVVFETLGESARRARMLRSNSRGTQQMEEMEYKSKSYIPQSS